MLTPKEALTHFPVSQPTITPVAIGLIHNTWKIEAKEGTYILQQVAPIFAPTVMEDTEAIQTHLAQQNLLTAPIIHTTTNKLFVEDEQRFWRMFQFIDGTVFTSTHQNPDIVRAAAYLLGTYHRVLNSCTYTFKHVRSAKHNIPAYYKTYKQVAKHNLTPEWQQRATPIETMETLMPPAHFRHTVTHGDPKISNIIFDKSTKKPTAKILIDLDDCGRQYNASMELASALKSWCQKSDEAPNNTFSLPCFKAALEGYNEGSQNFLLKEETDWLAKGLQLLPLELASRFLCDAFEDKYFAWDPNKFPSRKEHNFARAHGQLALYKNIMSQLTEITEIIKEKASDFHPNA